MSYQITIDHKADKVIDKLDKKTIKRIAERLDEQAVNPYDQRISGPVEMGKGQRKSRVGDWRIIFKIDEENLIIKITAVRPRRRAYPKQ
jgi:mRNA interferase RelE/StbE